MAYSYTLAERVQNLLRMGREVVIVGDLNIAHLPIDQCGNVGRLNREDHLNEHPARRWLDQFLAPNGDFHDVTREHHPGRKAMYTCWDTVKDTRPANYGARIDYTLVSKGLLPWVKFADIQANVYGSDHCPIFVDFHEEIISKDGTTIRLQDLMKTNAADGKRKLPALATACWPEFAGRRLQSFFAAKPATVGVPALSPSELPAPSALQSPLPTPASTALAVAEKRKAIESGPLSPAKKLNTTKKALTPKASPGQMKLNTFFSKPKAADTSIGEQVAVPLEDSQPLHIHSQEPSSPPSQLSAVVNKEDEDPSEGASRVESALAWGSIFARK